MRRRVLAPCLLALGCGSPRPLLDVSPAPRGQVEMAPASADVWAFSIAVSARFTGDRRAVACWFDTGKHRVDALRRTDAFTARIGIDEGENAVVAACRDDDGHVFRSQPVVYAGRLADSPTAQASAIVRDNTIVLDGSTSQVAAHSLTPLASFSWYVRRGPSGSPQAMGTGQRVEVAQPGDDGEYTYELRVVDARGRVDSASIGLDVSRGVARIATARVTPPAWTDAAVLYGVIPPLFGMPPLRAVRAALPDLEHLGVAALWLSPIFEAAPGDFGYAVTDYRRVRRDYGTLDDLRELTRDAHARGLRVLLDIVPNHTSDAHPYYRQAAALGRRSHYYDFYERDAAGAAMHYFDWTNLPNLAYRNPEVRAFMTAVGLEWIREAAIDGYRVDAAWGVRAREPSFFPQWIAELSRISPRAFLIAEASARDPFYIENGFGAAYDWTDQLGHAAWEHVFDAPDGIARRLDDAVETTRRAAGEHARPLRFLNDNDTGARFITRHGVALTRVATVALLTLPGVPLLYTFDEGGAAFEPYDEQPPKVRAPHPELVDFHAELIRLRHDVAPLHGAGLEVLHVGTQDEGYVYLRRAQGTSAVAVVALNFGATPAKLSVVLPGNVLTPGNSLRQLFASPAARLRGATFELPPYGYEILVSE